LRHMVTGCPSTNSPVPVDLPQATSIPAKFRKQNIV
jgi:hypothetical protein